MCGDRKKCEKYKRKGKAKVCRFLVAYGGVGTEEGSVERKCNRYTVCKYKVLRIQGDSPEGVVTVI